MTSHPAGKMEHGINGGGLGQTDETHVGIIAMYVYYGPAVEALHKSGNGDARATLARNNRGVSWEV